MSALETDGFALHPLEAFLTFFPIVFFCDPRLGVWAPLHFPFLASFTALNFYLHCGYKVKLLERWLPGATARPIAQKVLCRVVVSPLFLSLNFFLL